jgi:hypothetical protein
VGGIIELAALARLVAVRERRFGNRKSVCPYKRPYNSGTTRIRLLPSPSVMAKLTCGKLPVGHCRAPSFPACFRFPKPCAKVRILPGAPKISAGGERSPASGARFCHSGAEIHSGDAAIFELNRGRVIEACRPRHRCVDPLRTQPLWGS